MKLQTILTYILNKRSRITIYLYTHGNQIVGSGDVIIFQSRFVFLKTSKDQTHFLSSSKKGKFKNGTQTVLLFHN